MFGLKHQNWLNLNITEVLNVCQYISNDRLGMIIRKLCRAATFDRWNSLDGEFDFSMGDLAFKPKNQWEQKFWESARMAQKEAFIKLHSRAITPVENEQKAPASPKPQQPAPKQIQIKLPVKQDTPPQPKRTNYVDKDKINSLINSLGQAFTRKQYTGNGITIMPDTDMANLCGRVGDFLKENFNKKTLAALTMWLRTNYLGRECKIDTIIKTACKISKLDYNVIMATYLRCCT